MEQTHCGIESIRFTGNSSESLRSAVADCRPAYAYPTDEATQLASMFKAIANPVRLQMVDLISRLGGQICVCDIENQFELSQPTISHHLKILRKAGIIDCERRGQWLFYFARQEALTILEQFLSGLMDEQDVVP